VVTGERTVESRFEAMSGPAPPLLNARRSDEEIRAKVEEAARGYGMIYPNERS
jgi:hypothetical protein